RAPIGNRTLDLLLTMETLCRLSYRGNEERGYILPAPRANRGEPDHGSDRRPALPAPPRPPAGPPRPPGHLHRTRPSPSADFVPWRRVRTGPGTNSAPGHELGTRSGWSASVHRSRLVTACPQHPTATPPRPPTAGHHSSMVNMARPQGLVLTAEEGYSRLRSEIDAGALIRLRRGAYLAEASPDARGPGDEWAQRAAVLLARCHATAHALRSRFAFSHGTAAFLHGWPGPMTDAVHVLMPVRASARHAADIVRHHTAELAEED